MKNFFTILAVLISSFLPFIAFAQVNLFRDLFLGISGSDVITLQKFLNQDADTAISTEGPGSSGSETDYFGALTKAAVEKFQIKYSDYILKPVGLAVPTGYVGVSTRDFLNKMFSSYSGAEIKTSKNGDKPVIDSISPDRLYGKTKITLLGRNFTDKNTIIVTLESRTDLVVPSTDNGTKIEFEFESSIQKKFDEEKSDMSKKTQEKMLQTFPKYDLAVSVITDEGQSNFKTIQFNLK